MAAVSILLLTSCSDPGATTCDEYAAMSSGDRSSLERDLLTAHDLEPNHLGNTLGVAAALENFCGVEDNTLALPGSDTSSRNNSSTVDEAVDWNSSQW